MASRPAKRRKTSTVLSSDDDEPSSLPVRGASRQNNQLSLDQDASSKLVLSPSKSKNGNRVTSTNSLKGSPKSSPDKNRKTKNTIHQPEKTKSLHNFFSKATEEQRWSRKAESVTNDIFDDGEFGDAIEDEDFLDEGLLSLDEGGGLSQPVSNVAAKLKREVSNNRTPTSSQRFAKPSIPLKRASTDGDVIANVTTELYGPWSERYGPDNLDELAVHKKKVSDVQGWLEDALSGRARHKVLILKGSAGTGKTTTLSLVAKHRNMELVTWHNPVAYEAGVNATSGQLFDDFVNRGGHFSSLSLDGPFHAAVPDDSSSPKRVLVVEEFPNTISRSSQAHNAFRSTILQFLARSQSSTISSFHTKTMVSDQDPPLVLIISETLLTSSTAFNDSFTTHRLLGQEILSHPLVTVMEFNPVAPTFITKALEVVIKKEARDSKRRRAPGHAVIQRLAQVGDLRSAINSLEFLCVRGDDSADWSGTVAAKSKKSVKDSSTLTKMEASSLQLITQRETTLDMFHAAGKIMYNKREDLKVHDTRASPPPKPPDHLMYLYKPKASQVDIEALLNETGTDIQTFISTLHENYVLSCNGDTFVDSLEACAETLSMADVLNPDSRRTRRSNLNNPNSNGFSSLQMANAESLRQDEISFQVATRGLLFSLPYPVSRAAPVNGRKSDAFKMFYPTSLRIWKPTEEIESLISLFVNDASMLSPSQSSQSRKTANQAYDGGVASWQSRTSNSSMNHFAQHKPSSSPISSLEDDPQPIQTMSSYLTLTLEILPYLTNICHARGQDTKTLSKITQLRGTGVPLLDNQSSFDEEPHDNEPGQSFNSHTSTQNQAGLSSKPIPSASKLLNLVDTFTAKIQKSAAPAPTSGSGTSSFGSSKSINSLKVKMEETEHDRISTQAHTLDMDKLYISDDDIED